MSERELEKLEAELRRGEIPEDLLAGVEEVDSATILITLWAGRLSRRVDAFYQEALRPHGLKYSDYSVLSILRFAGAMSPKLINSYLAITSSGLTKAIQRLEKEALVARRPDPEDGRGTLLSLSKKGRRTLVRIFRQDILAHDNLFQDFAKDDQERIATALRDLLDVFENVTPKPR